MVVYLSNTFATNIAILEDGINIGKLYISIDKLTYIAIKFMRILFIIILIYLIINIGSTIIHKFMYRQRKSNSKFTLNEKRSMTLEAILKSVLRYTAYFFGIVGILTEVFGTISLTFAGIGGVAIGLGAQSIIKDIFNGFFILFEDQYAVGEYINIDDKGGIVESIELRVTKLRDFNGDLHIIPNGLITKVTNHSRGAMRILIEVDIPYDADTDRAIEIVNAACENFKLKNKNLVEGPKVLGVSALKESSLTIKVMGKTIAMTQWDTEMELRKEIKLALEKGNIEAPYPKRKIMKG